MENLFSQFNGADLDRLVECIKAIKKAGLYIDKYTMAGVNDSSGNVWVANEAWRGCVFMSGFCRVYVGRGYRIMLIWMPKGKSTKGALFRFRPAVDPDVRLF